MTNIIIMSVTIRVRPIIFQYQEKKSLLLETSLTQGHLEHSGILLLRYWNIVIFGTKRTPLEVLKFILPCVNVKFDKIVSMYKCVSLTHSFAHATIYIHYDVNHTLILND